MTGGGIAEKEKRKERTIKPSATHSKWNGCIKYDALPLIIRDLGKGLVPKIWSGCTAELGLGLKPGPAVPAAWSGPVKSLIIRPEGVGQKGTPPSPSPHSPPASMPNGVNGDGGGGGKSHYVGEWAMGLPAPSHSLPPPSLTLPWEGKRVSLHAPLRPSQGACGMGAASNGHPCKGAHSKWLQGNSLTDKGRRDFTPPPFTDEAPCQHPQSNRTLFGSWCSWLRSPRWIGGACGSFSGWYPFAPIIPIQNPPSTSHLLCRVIPPMALEAHSKTAVYTPLGWEP